MQLNMKTYCHKDLLNLLEKYNAIKSVPPVEAFPFKAMTIAKPYKNPPKATFRMISSNKGSNEVNFSRADVVKTLIKLKMVKRGEMFLAQNNATGMFNANRTKEDEIPPFVSISTNKETPVNPVEIMDDGRIIVWMT